MGSPKQHKNPGAPSFAVSPRRVGRKIYPSHLSRDSMHRKFLLATLLLAPVLASAQSHPRQIQQFTTGWRFLQSDAPNAQSPTFDDSAWKPVTLPHDWSIPGPVQENAPPAPREASSP